MNNFTTVQELSRTLKNAQGQQNALRIKEITSFDSKFKESPWRSMTSGTNLSCPSRRTAVEQKRHAAGMADTQS